jgi:hypothetical protein
MTRVLAIAALMATGASFSAFAADETGALTGDSAVAAYTHQLSVSADAANIRRLLHQQGYSSISEPVRENEGRWTASATKDGKTVTVSVVLPPKGLVTASN